MKLASTSPPLGLLGPDSLEVFPKRVRVGDGWCATFAVTGYPREVGPGWLSPLVNYPGPIDVSLHVEPIPNEVAASRLRTQLGRFKSTLLMDRAKSRITNPEIEAAAEDASRLAADLTRGDGRLFRVGLLVTVRAPNEKELEAETHKVRSLAASLLLETRPTVFRAIEGWVSTLPLALDRIKMRRTFDTKALAASFPFSSADLNHTGGILYGRNAVTGGLVFLDRFSLDNYNQVILAESGKGKSYLTKLMVLRSLCLGIEVLVVDPEDEYARLAEAVGGTVVRLGPDGSRLNPLDLSPDGSAQAFFDRAQFLHTIVQTLIGKLTPDEAERLDAAVQEAYEKAGISSDPRTHRRPAPVLGDVAARLADSDVGRSLARRLRPYIEGGQRGLLDEPTSVRPEGHLVVFSLKDLPDESKPAGILLALDAVWRRVTSGERKRRIVVVDEAWQILQSRFELGARFVQDLAKSGRKHWCGLTTVTQNISDVLSTNFGSSILTNASSQILLGLKPQEIQAVAEAFNLSQGEQRYLATCERGRGLICVGNTERAPIEVIASEAEHPLITTDPAEISAMEASR